MQQQKRVQTIDGYARPVQPQPEVEPVTSLARRSNFVPAASRVIEVQPPVPMEGFNVPSPAQSMVELRTSYTDRSRGFVWAITPVAAITGLLSCVAGVALFAVPALSFAILTWFLTAFCLTWIVGYVAHLLLSPDGALFANTWFLWRTVQREQKHRHDRYWTSYRDARRDSGRQ